MNLDAKIKLNSSCLSGGGGIQEREVLAQTFRQDGGLRLSHGNILEILSAMEKAVNRLSHRLYGHQPTQNAMNKCRGFWFEIMVAWVANNVSAKDRTPMYVRLDSNKGDGFAPLLCDSMRSAIDPKRHLGANPDLLVLSPKCKGFLPPREFKWLDIDKVNTLANQHRKLIGKLGLGDIRGAISVKVSLRPDRKELIPFGGIKFKPAMIKAWEGVRKFGQRIKKAYKPEHHAIVADRLGNTKALRQPVSAMDESFPLDSTTQTRTYKELRDALANIGRSCMGRKSRKGVFVGGERTEKLL